MRGPDPIGEIQARIFVANSWCSNLIEGSLLKPIVFLHPDRRDFVVKRKLRLCSVSVICNMPSKPTCTRWSAVSPGLAKPPNEREQFSELRRRKVYGSYRWDLLTPSPHTSFRDGSQEAVSKRPFPIALASALMIAKKDPKWARTTHS